MRTAIVLVLVCTAAAAAAFLAFGHKDSRTIPAAQPAVTAPPVPASTVHPTGKYLGIAVPRDGVKSFATLTGRPPDIYEEYTGFGTSFIAPPAGMLPLVNLESHAPTPVVLSGRYDAYLRTFAHSVAAYRKPVAISVDPEMNGPWYIYGTRQTSHAEFRAIYRHVHDVLTAEGARNIIWTWTITRGIARLPLLKELYPGNAYVDWVGIDGYFNSPRSNFASVFRGAFRDVRTFTNRPFLITETSARPGPQAALQVRELFAGVRSTPGILGFVWFDYDKRADWRLEDDPAALTAFRRAARNW